MSETKHTPGPWSVDEDDQNGQAVVRNAHIEIATCWHHCVGSIETEMRHNARLIAAAPDLLGELSRMVEHFEVFASDHSMDASTETWSALYCAKAAIAKAGGSSSAKGLTPSEAFSAALTALPKLADAAGCYVGIKVTEAKRSQP